MRSPLPHSWFGLALSSLAVALAGQTPAVRLPSLTVQADEHPQGPDVHASRLFGATSPGLSPEAVQALGTLSWAESGAGTFGSLLSSRGLSNTPYFGDAAVTLYVGDLPLSGPAATPGLFPGLQRARLLSPADTPFALGRATHGGTLQLDFAPPASRGGELRLQGGDYGLRAAEAGQRWSQGPVWAGLHLTSYQRNGYVKRADGGDLGSLDRHAARAELGWSPSDDLSLRLSWLGSRGRDGGQPFTPLGAPRDRSPLDVAGASDQDFHGVALRLDHRSTLGLLSLISSHSDWRLSPYQGALLLPPRLDSRLHQEQRASQQEVRWVAPPTAAFPWSTGLFWGHTRTQGEVTRSLLGTVPIESSAHQHHRKVLAGFGRAVLMDDEVWRFEGALRWERDQQTFARTAQIPAPSALAAQRQEVRLNPGFFLTRRLPRGESIALAWTESVKPGGFSAYTDRADLAPFAPERNRAWHLNWTAPTRRGHTRSLRLYHQDLRHVQIERSYSATDYLVGSARRARSQGIEWQEGLSLSPSWRLDASLGWVRTRLREFTLPLTGETLQTGVLPFAPRLLARMQLEGHLGGDFALATGIQHTGRTPFDESGATEYSQTGYTTLRLELRYRRGPWTLALRGENLTEEGYATLISPGIRHQVSGAPRHFSLELGRSW